MEIAFQIFAHGKARGGEGVEETLNLSQIGVTLPSEMFPGLLKKTH